MPVCGASLLPPLSCLLPWLGCCSQGCLRSGLAAALIADHTQRPKSPPREKLCLRESRGTNDRTLPLWSTYGRAPPRLMLTCLICRQRASVFFKLFAREGLTAFHMGPIEPRLANSNPQLQLPLKHLLICRAGDDVVGPVGQELGRQYAGGVPLQAIKQKAA